MHNTTCRPSSQTLDHSIVWVTLEIPKPFLENTPLLPANMLKEFGNNIILIDSTHGTTGYDFQLMSIVVVDELGEGYPTVGVFLAEKT